MKEEMFAFLETPLYFSPEVYHKRYGNSHLGVRKVALIGDKDVGRTSLVSRIVDNTYTDGPQWGREWKTHEIDFLKNKIKLQIWDFRRSSQPYYHIGKDTALVVLCFDLSNRASFDILTRRLKELESTTYPNYPILLMGTKCDLERAVTYEEAKNFADSIRDYDGGEIRYIETSAKDNINIQEALQVMAYCAMERRASTPPRNENPRGFWRVVQRIIPCAYPQPPEPGSHSQEGPRLG